MCFWQAATKHTNYSVGFLVLVLPPPPSPLFSSSRSSASLCKQSTRTNNNDNNEGDLCSAHVPHKVGWKTGRCTITLATQDNATADGVFRAMDPNLCWFVFVHAAESRHQALRTALGFPCLARQWNRKSLRWPQSSGHLRHQLGEGGQNGARSSHRLHWGQWTVLMSITSRSLTGFTWTSLGSVNSVHVDNIGVIEQCSRPLQRGRLTGLIPTTSGSVNSVDVHYIEVG